jgi:hypothetical protein
MPQIGPQADLYQHWRALMGELGFAAPPLWMVMIDGEGTCTP